MSALLKSKTHFFIHIPKCGGNTFSEFLSRHFHLNSIYTAEQSYKDWVTYRETLHSFNVAEERDQWRALNSLNDYFLAGMQHSQLVAFNHFSFYTASMLAKTHDLILYCVFREPKLRVAAHYQHLRRITPNLTHSLAQEGNLLYDFARSVDIEDFCSALHRADVWNAIFNCQARVLASEPVNRFLLQSIGEQAIVDDALNNMAKIKYVADISCLQEFAELLSQEQEWPAPGHLGVMNQGSHAADELLTLAEKVPNEVVVMDERIVSEARERYRVWRDKLKSSEEAGISRAPEIPPFGPDKQWVLDFRAPLNGTNFHSREGDNSDIFRWMGPETKSTLLLALKAGKSNEITIYVKAAISADVLWGTSYSIDDQVQQAKLSNDGQWTLVCLKAPAHLSSRGWCELAIHAPSVSSEIAEGW